MGVAAIDAGHATRHATRHAAGQSFRARVVAGSGAWRATVPVLRLERSMQLRRHEATAQAQAGLLHESNQQQAIFHARQRKVPNYHEEN
jgi:hypothetical protein